MSDLRDLIKHQKPHTHTGFCLCTTDRTLHHAILFISAFRHAINHAYLRFYISDVMHGVFQEFISSALHFCILFISAGRKTPKELLNLYSRYFWDGFSYMTNLRTEVGSFFDDCPCPYHHKLVEWFKKAQNQTIYAPPAQKLMWNALQLLLPVEILHVCIHMF